MATVTFIKYQKQSAGALHGVAGYVSQKQKTQQEDGWQLVSGQNCMPQLAAQEFIATRQMHRKDSPVWFYHYVQSFSPDEEITGALAHQVAQEFSQRAWPDSEVLIATHSDAEHIHTHFIVNSVCYETGKMLRQGPSTLKNLRALSDELCMKYGLSVLEKQQPKRAKGMSGREYRSAVKGESWKFRLMNTIDQCMQYASTKEEIRGLERELSAMRKRDGELDVVFKRMYEDSALGRVSNEHFRLLSEAYSKEKAQLAEAIPATEERLEKLRSSMANAKNFIAKARRFTDMTELTPELLRTFVAKIIVYEKEVKYSKHAPQKIQICFRDFNLNETDDVILCGETKEKADSATALPA